MSENQDAQTPSESTAGKATKWSRTWGDRPSPEAMAAMVQNDPKGQAATVEDKIEAKRRRDIVKKFRLGAKHLCAINLWNKVLVRKGVLDLDTSKQAESLGVGDQVVRNYKKGELSFENWLAFLTDLKTTLGSFDSLPTTQERAIAGYRLAIASLSSDETYICDINEDALISLEELLTYFSFCGDPLFIERRFLDEPVTENDWLDIAARTQDSSLGPNRGIKVQRERADRFRAIFERWGELVDQVIQAVPHAWFQKEQP